MGSIIVEQDFPHDISRRGQSDANRHNKRVQKAVRRQLKDVISQQDIITSEGNKKVKVRLKYLDQYRFRHNKDRIDDVGRDEFDELEDGEILSRPEKGGGGRPEKAGDNRGEEIYETEYTIDELTDMMIEELQLPNLDETKKNEITSDVLEYTDRRKRVGVTALLDKRKTLQALIKRKAQLKLGVHDKIPIIEDDLVFKTWEITTEKHSNAVIFLMMDRSASMWESKIYAVKALYFWVVQFLKRKYNKVEIKFIAHDYYAKELTEKEFFSIADSGGTKVSSAYEMCRDMINHNYPSSMWNIYCFHGSDGDSWGDEVYCAELAREIVNLGAKMFAYAEIDMDNYRSGMSELYRKLDEESSRTKKLIVASIQDVADVVDVLSKFLKQAS